MVYLGTSETPGPMLEKFIQSISSPNLFELAFELIWEKYMDDDIASVMDIPAWEPIDDVLCTLARRIRQAHPGRKLRVVLSVVAPQSADLRRVKMGTLFSKFREEGVIALQYFIDYLPPVSFTTSLCIVGAHCAFCRACTLGICLNWHWGDRDAKLDLVISFFE